VFMTSGRTDPELAQEWITKAAELSRRVERHDPLLGFALALERLLHGPDAFVSAFEPLLTEDDPWVRAIARLQLGKQRIMAGQDPEAADAYLETALAEFRATGERWGISFALTELANRIATRGDFAGACELYEQAIAVVTEVGALEDLVSMRSRQAQLHWLQGDADASAAAMAEAQRAAERVAWPNALAELALAKAELARWTGDADQAHRQLALATTMLGEYAEQEGVRAMTEDLLGYLATDLDEARAHRLAAFRASAEAGNAPQVAGVLVGLADLALRCERYEQAARLLAASAAVRGVRDHAQPDVDRIERAARAHLGDTRFAEATEEGTRADWRELAIGVLTS
jgi:hypothetical protein